MLKWFTYPGVLGVSVAVLEAPGERAELLAGLVLPSVVLVLSNKLSLSDTTPDVELGTKYYTPH